MNLCTSPQPHAKARTAALRRLALVLALLVLAALACSEGAEPPPRPNVSNVDQSVDNSIETMPLCRYNCVEQTGIVNSAVQVGEPELNIASDNQFGGQRSVTMIDGDGNRWCVPEAEADSGFFQRLLQGNRGSARPGDC